MGNVGLKKEVTLKHNDVKNGSSQPKKNKWWLWLLLLVVIVAVILCVRYCSSNGDKKIVTEPTTMPIQETQSTATEDIAVSEEPASTPVSEPTTQSATNNKPAPTTLPQETIEEKAKQVIRGNFGNGAARKQALGGEYDTIQRRVNEMYGLPPRNEY